MTPRGVTLAAVASLLLCAAALAAGADSHRRGALVGRVGGSWSLYARSEYGRVFLLINATDAGDRPRWLSGTWPLDWDSPGPVDWWDRGGFGYAVGGTPGGNAIRQLAIPYWSLALVAALPPAALFVRRWRRRRQSRAGLCPSCGYDLRATPERCPECGAARAR